MVKLAKHGDVFRRQVRRLKKLFEAGGVKTQLAFISSCKSELTGNAFVEAGVPHVVAVKAEEAVAGKVSEIRASGLIGYLV